MPHAPMCKNIVCRRDQAAKPWTQLASCQSEPTEVGIDRAAGKRLRTAHAYDVTVHQGECADAPPSVREFRFNRAWLWQLRNRKAHLMDLQVSLNRNIGVSNTSPGNLAHTSELLWPTPAHNDPRRGADSGFTYGCRRHEPRMLWRKSASADKASSDNGGGPAAILGAMPSGQPEDTGSCGPTAGGAHDATHRDTGRPRFAARWCATVPLVRRGPGG